MIYLLDANVLITAHQEFLAVDRVPEFWSWLEHMAAKGIVQMPIETYDEVKDGPNDEEDLLFSWIQQEHVASKLILPGEVVPTLVQTVLGFGYAFDLTDSELDHIGQDPFLIAHAMADPVNRCVVTAEGSKPTALRKNRRVPDVCNAVGVKSMNLVKMLRELDFRTNWSAGQ